jgi:MFS family permease
MRTTDTTITSTISSAISSDFHSLATISWLGSAYLVALAATQPLSGKLSDIFGRRNSFIVVSILFAVGNLVCGLAQSQVVLILGRVLAGIGGGGCNSMSNFIASDHIPLKERGFWQGIANIIFAVGVGLGGVVGGVLNDTWGWRWAFIILGPWSLISAIGGAIYIPPKTSQKEGLSIQLKRIDFGGCFTLVSSLTLLLLGLNEEQQGLTVEIALPLSAGLFVLFLIIEWRYAQEPVIPLSLISTRPILATYFSAWFMTMMFYTLMFYIPIYFQLLGLNTSETGVRILVEPVGGGIGAFLAGLALQATGRYELLNLLGSVISIAGAIGFATMDLGTTLILPAFYMFFNGLGFGMRQTVLLVGLIGSVDHEQHAIATSVLDAFRSSGAVVGLSFAGALFRYQVNRPLKLQDIRDPLEEGPRSTSLSEALGCLSKGQDYCHTLKEIYMSSLHWTFLLALSFAVASFFCGLFVGNTRSDRRLYNSLVDSQSADEED